MCIELETQKKVIWSLKKRKKNIKGRRRNITWIYSKISTYLEINTNVYKLTLVTPIVKIP